MSSSGLGHDAVMAAEEIGPWAGHVERGGVRVAREPHELPDECDAVLANDAITGAALAERYPGARLVHFVHSPIYDHHSRSSSRASPRRLSSPRTWSRSGCARLRSTRRSSATGAIVLPPAEIGEEAVVGAASLVREDVPARTVVAGTPARALRRVRDDELLEAWREPPG